MVIVVVVVVTDAVAVLDLDVEVIADVTIPPAARPPASCCCPAADFLMGDSAFAFTLEFDGVAASS